MIGGCAKTDTTYLSGNFGADGNEASPSPRRVPSAMAGILIIEQRAALGTLEMERRCRCRCRCRVSRRRVTRSG